MPTTVAQTFDEFARRIEPTALQKSDASVKQTGIRSCLEGRLTAAQGSGLIGSYARSTMIRPPDDIDLMFVMDYSQHGTFYTTLGGEQLALARCHAVLKNCYPDTPMRKDHPTIHLNFVTIGFDVIPAFQHNAGGFVIPSRTGAGWMRTNPQKHAELTTAINRGTNGSFVPLVKMFKAWNAAHFSRLTGFHIELLLALSWPRSSGGGLMVYATASLAAAALFPALAGRIGSYVPDPAGLSGTVDQYLDPTDRQRTRERLSAAASEALIALRHEARGDHYSAITKWRDVFGDAYPAYS